MNSDTLVFNLGLCTPDFEIATQYPWIVVECKLLHLEEWMMYNGGRYMLDDIDGDWHGELEVEIEREFERFCMEIEGLYWR